VRPSAANSPTTSGGTPRARSWARSPGSRRSRAKRRAVSWIRRSSSESARVNKPSSLSPLGVRVQGVVLPSLELEAHQRQMDLPRTIGLMGPPPRPGGRPGVSVIRPVLLVGEYPLPEDAAWLRDQHGVTAVLSLRARGAVARGGARRGQAGAAVRAVHEGSGGVLWRARLDGPRHRSGQRSDLVHAAERAGALLARRARGILRRVRARRRLQ